MTKTPRIIGLFSALALLAVLPGCNKKGGSASSEKRAAKVDPAAQKEADEVWSGRCVSCHGNSGMGDGAAAAALNPKPRSFKSAEWQKSVSDEHIKKVIVGGGPAVGKSPLMAPNPDLKGKEAVLTALVNKVRSFSK